MSFQLGRAWAKLILEIDMPEVAPDPFITIKGHYTGYPSGGVPQTDKDIGPIFVERGGKIPGAVRRIVSRLIAYYLSKYL